MEEEMEEEKEKERGEKAEEKKEEKKEEGEEYDDQADLVLHPKLLPQFPQQIFLCTVCQKCRARSIESCLRISCFISQKCQQRSFLQGFVSFMIVRNMVLPLPSEFQSGPRSASAPANAEKMDNMTMQ